MPDSEAALLAHEAAAAEAAARAALRELQAALRRSADVRAWVERYPWWAVGAAAVAGLAAAVVVAPRRGESLGDGLSKFTTATNGDSEAAHAAAGGDKPRSTIWDSLLPALFDILKSALQAAIQASMAAKTERSAAANAEETAADGSAAEI